ncbi:MAG: NAD(P)H-quinone oxidoreductase [Thermoanaerobaculia bacterium]|nr:NAD(P)H-quinone oxidoreductase [Thermoanaerobaculia bacterium]
MRALHYDPSVEGSGLHLSESPSPEIQKREVRVEIAATAINRADLLQVRGLYPVPPGESEIPGLECSGTIVEVGDAVESWGVGDRVMALLGGGGHAEEVAVPEGQLMPLPENLSFVEGAAVPEVGLTAWTNLVHEGRMDSGETVLITAAASGVGTFAVQLAFELGARVFVAGRKRERLERLRRLGADVCLDLGKSLPAAVREANGGEGVDLALDLVGGPGFVRTLAALRDRGRVVLVGLLDGSRAEVDLADVLRRRLRIRGSVLRSRSREEKARLVEAFRKVALPRLADARLRPIVDRMLPFEELPEAYRVLKEEEVLGKVVVKMR